VKVKSLYNFLLQQMAAESYLESPAAWNDPGLLEQLLQLGSNREDFTDPNFTFNGGYRGLT